MNIATFMIVAIVFSVILLYNRSSQQKKEHSENAIAVQTPKPENDDYVRILSYNPKEYKSAFEFGKEIELGLEQTLSHYQVRNCTCSIEFVTVGLCLVAVIHIKTLPGKKKRGFKELWSRQ